MKLNQVETFHIITYGCQMNEAESLRIATILNSKGKTQSQKIEEADLLIINSCSVRQGSEDKVYGLGEKVIPLKSQKLKANSQWLFVILIGCMVGSAKGERRRYKLAKLKQKMPWIDEFMTYEELVENLGSLRGSRLSGFAGFARTIRPEQNALAENNIKKQYLIPISQGCNNFCSYCVVPYSRGEEVSRSEEEILCEIEKAVKAGHTEIMLLGQNVNSYGNIQNPKSKNQDIKTELPFSKLLKKVHAMPEVEKISFLTLNPYDINDELIETLTLPKIDRYIHLPIQSGDNEVLKKMNRKNTVEEYKDIVKRMRLRIPGVKIGTDIIVGFPGETTEAFENTLKLVKEIGFKQIFAGIYSVREGTSAAKLTDNLALEEKKRRHKELLKVWKNATESRI